MTSARGTRIRQRSRRKAGLSLAGLAHLDELSRTLTMMRAGAGLFDDEGRDQWLGNCERCGRERWLSWCHVFTRETRATRWDPDNVNAWCSGCHRELDQHWKRKESWVIEKIGQRRYDALVLRANGGARHPDYEAIRVSLEGEIAKMIRRA